MREQEAAVPRGGLVVLDLAVASAVAIAAALWDSSFHVLPTATGTWRGVADPPGALRAALSVLCGGAAAALLSRFPPAVRKPFVFFFLAAGPLVPVLTGRFLPLLAFQGPMLWLLAGAIVAVAAVRMAPFFRFRPGRVPVLLLFAAAFVFYAAWGTRVPGPAGPQGDEPHYLVMTHSLLTDGDLDLTDEFADREYAGFYGGDLAPHTSPNSPPGKLYSMHSPGLPALLLPSYALGGYPGARLFVSALAALTGALIYRLVREPLGDDALAAGMWALVALTPPLPFYAVTLYPETLAALATVAYLLTARREPSRSALITATVLAALLPWVHTKLIPLAALGLAFTLLKPYSWRARLLAPATLLVSLALLAFYFQTLYGSPSFAAALGPSDLSMRRVGWGAAGLFFDRQYGLFTVAPALALALPGAVLLRRRHPGDTVRALVLVALPVIPAAAYIGWWGGACPPARYILPVLGPMALAAAAAVPLARDAVAALGGIGLAIVGLAAGAPRMLRNRPDGESLLLSSLSPDIDLNAWLPSFMEEGPRGPILAVSLAAAAALAWRWRGRGLLLGILGYGLVAQGLRDRPLIDQRLAGQRVLWEWDADAGWALSSSRGLQGLVIPFELPRRPWVLEPGQARNSRRLLLPPGGYRVQMRIRPLSETANVRLALHAGPLLLAQADLSQAHASAVLPLLLPVGGRGLGLTAAGLAGRADVEEVWIEPEALVPRRRREDFPWPEMAEPERYRVGAGNVRVTVLDRSVPEAGGFRVQGEGSFVVDAPAGGIVQAVVRRAGPGAGDRFTWGARDVPLASHPELVLDLSMADGVELGRASVVPVRMRSPDAWIAFSAPGPG